MNMSFYRPSNDIMFININTRIWHSIWQNEGVYDHRYYSIILKYSNGVSRVSGGVSFSLCDCIEKIK